MLHKATITLSDNPDGGLDLKCVFDPEIHDDTRSFAVNAALEMIEWFSNRTSRKETSDA